MNIKRRRLPKVSRSVSRDEQGALLVEMLIAVLVLSILMATMMQGIAQTGQTGTATQNQIIAANIAQELVDQARNAQWATICSAGIADGAWHDVAVYGAPVSGQPAYLPRSVMYNGTTAAGQANQFRGSVRQRVEPMGVAVPPNEVRLTVEVSWPGENTSQGTRTMTATSYISRWGIHN